MKIGRVSPHLPVPPGSISGAEGSGDPRPMRKKAQPSRHLRGYTNAHVARRRQLEPLVATGRVACCRCGELIHPQQTWHLDGRDDRRGYLGLAHATCNLRAAGIKTAQLRNANTAPRWSRIW
jgi:hypothetical protein